MSNFPFRKLTASTINHKLEQTMKWSLLCGVGGTDIFVLFNPTLLELDYNNFNGNFFRILNEMTY